MGLRFITTTPWPWLIYLSSFIVIYVLPMALEYQTRANGNAKLDIEHGILVQIESVHGVIQHIDNRLFFYLNLLENPIFKFFLSALILQWFYQFVSRLND